MLLIRRGQRLSIQPVEAQDFDTILSMGGLNRNEL
jgi:predicted RNA-binding protein with PUA-like domain